MAEKKAVSDAPMRIRSPLRSILKVTGFAADTASSLVSVILRLVGTFLLIVLITGILFSCIFAYYVLVSFLIFLGFFKKIVSFLFRKLAFIHSFMVSLWFS